MKTTLIQIIFLIVRTKQIEEDVKSDFHDEPSDTEEGQIRSFHNEEEEGWSSSDNLPLNELQENSSLASVIVELTQANIRGKNRHVWATCKGRTSSRSSAINIVRMARGPTRSDRGISDPLLLFGSFMTNEICDEI